MDEQRALCQHVHFPLKQVLGREVGCRGAAGEPGLHVRSHWTLTSVGLTPGTAPGPQGLRAKAVAYHVLQSVWSSAPRGYETPANSHGHSSGGTHCPLAFS